MEQRTKFKFVVHYLMMSGNISPKSPHPTIAAQERGVCFFIDVTCK